MQSGRGDLHLSFALIKNVPDIIGYGNYHLTHYDRENDSTNVLEIMFPTGITQSKYCRTVC